MSLVYYRPGSLPSEMWTSRILRSINTDLILLVCYYYIDYIARIKPQKTLANVFVLQTGGIYAQYFTNYAAWSMTVEFSLCFVHSLPCGLIVNPQKGDPRFRYARFALR
jgi:hypothetical protein